MDISVSTSGNVTVAEIEGSLDTVTSPEADRRLNELIDNGTTRLVVSFINLDFLSSAGLRTLLGVAKRLARSDGELRVADLNSTVREIFTISGFDTIIKVHDSREEAILELQ